MAIDGAIAQYQENAGTVNHARGLRRIVEKEMTDFDVRIAGGLATSGINNGGVSRWLPPASGIAKGDCAVVQRGAGANMSVDVGQGGAIVGGTASATQGNYFVYNDAAVNLPIAAADATNPRIDVIGIQIRDTEYGEAASDCRLVVVTGTPAGSPAVPTLPAEFLTLAHVAVAALAATIVSANITDKRVSTGTGIVTCTSGSRPTNQLYAGQLIYETDTNKLQQYTTATTLWTPPWNLPWGNVAAPASVTANQTGIAASITDITGLTITYTSVANRRTKVTSQFVTVQNASQGTQNTYIRDGSSATIFTAGGTIASSFFTTWNYFTELVPAAGSVTYKASLKTSAGTVDVSMAATQPGVLIIEDCGPSTSPA